MSIALSQMCAMIRLERKEIQKMLEEMFPWLCTREVKQDKE